MKTKTPQKIVEIKLEQKLNRDTILPIITMCKDDIEDACQDSFDAYWSKRQKRLKPSSYEKELEESWQATYMWFEDKDGNIIAGFDMHSNYDINEIISSLRRKEVFTDDWGNNAISDLEFEALDIHYISIYYSPDMTCFSAEEVYKIHLTK